jgi:hypothetical protein
MLNQKSGLTETIRQDRKKKTCSPVQGHQEKHVYVENVDLTMSRTIKKIKLKNKKTNSVNSFYFRDVSRTFLIIVFVFLPFRSFFA